MSTIQRIGKSTRASDAVVFNGIALFAVTPERPYDGSLGAEEQTRQLLAKLDQRLAELGSERKRLLFVTIILADMSDYDAMNSVWDSWIDQDEPPGRACFEARLASPAMKVEMVVQAAGRV